MLQGLAAAAVAYGFSYDHLRQISHTLGHGLDVDHPADIVPAVAHEDSNPRLFARHVALRGQIILASATTLSGVRSCAALAAAALAWTMVSGMSLGLSNTPQT